MSSLTLMAPASSGRCLPVALSSPSGVASETRGSLVGEGESVKTPLRRSGAVGGGGDWGVASTEVGAEPFVAEPLVAPFAEPFRLAPLEPELLLAAPLVAEPFVREGVRTTGSGREAGGVCSRARRSDNQLSMGRSAGAAGVGFLRLSLAFGCGRYEGLGTGASIRFWGALAALPISRRRRGAGFSAAGASVLGALIAISLSGMGSVRGSGTRGPLSGCAAGAGGGMTREAASILRG